MTKIIIWSLVGFYGLGFALIFWVELSVGPVTPALALVRALAWPVYVATGWPQGQRAEMD